MRITALPIAILPQARPCGEGRYKQPFGSVLTKETPGSPHIACHLNAQCLGVGKAAFGTNPSHEGDLERFPIQHIVEFENVRFQASCFAREGRPDTEIRDSGQGASELIPIHFDPGHDGIDTIQRQCHVLRRDDVGGGEAELSPPEVPMYDHAFQAVWASEHPPRHTDATLP